MTDAQPIDVQHRAALERSAPGFSGLPPSIARPYEITTPREQSNQSEVDRILKLLDGLKLETPRA